MHSTKYLQALSDETRLRCFRVLAKSQVSLCVAELVDILQKPQYSISHSLAELRKAKLVQEERQGKLVFYSLNFLGKSGPALKDLAKWVMNHCDCQDSEAENHLEAGDCRYDDERLEWRLAIRNDGDVVHTYRQVKGQTKDGIKKQRVLFVCTHNAARSQIASAYLHQLAPKTFEVESAGIKAGSINPYVVKVLAQEGIDISKNIPRSVADVYKNANTYDWVITVCSPEAERDCPIFPGPVQKLSWPFEDPSLYEGSDEEILHKIRLLAVQIKIKVKEFIYEQR